jgi:hypothetical protein
VVEESVLPGMTYAHAPSLRESPDTAVSVTRSGPNTWWVALGPTTAAGQLEAWTTDATTLPSAALAALGPARSTRTAVIAKVELDECGAWVTVANSGPVRPILVRKAGWVDLRGHPDHAGARVPAPLDDRIGLGPGDVLALRSATTTEDDEEAALYEHLLDAALRCAGQAPDVLIEAMTSATPAGASDAHTVALGVPTELGEHPIERVADATGIPTDEIELPGYPLGDLQPDLWREPPRPPRLARLRLDPDLSGVSAVRSLLERLLASWRLDGRIDDGDLKLVATELASNAVTHTTAPDAVTVRYLGPVVRVEVTDGSSALPRPRTADIDDVRGRGLRLVDAIGSSWGVETLGDRKRVWCELLVERPGGECGGDARGEITER